MPDRRRLTPSEYLALEAVSPERLEYRNGYAVALAVPSKNHARIAGNLVMSLGPLVRAQGCDFFAGDVNVLASSGDRTIPDFVATCDERDRATQDERGEALLRHPWLAVEILSPETAADDTTDKLDAYRSIPELTHYIIIDSRRRWMRLYERMEDGSFALRGPLEELHLTKLTNQGLLIDEIYRDTTVPRILDAAPMRTDDR